MISRNTPRFSWHWHPSLLTVEQVINGTSDLFAEIWGEQNGIGARSAVGMGTLPDNIPVEVEAIFQLKSGLQSKM